MHCTRLKFDHDDEDHDHDDDYHNYRHHDMNIMTRTS